MDSSTLSSDGPSASGMPAAISGVSWCTLWSVKPVSRSATRCATPSSACSRFPMAITSVCTLAPLNAFEHTASLIAKLDDQRHLADGVGGTRKARIVAANCRFHAVEHALAELARPYEAASGLLDRHVHCLIVLPGGD